ncbi:MAG: putative manganese-dependent inorganic diphosphatase [Spirochaetaceae bacterium]|jgi:manganese-dependent inorganic pyrophosphatase|nr:putative manganese-dependent inorganic diphosphatase [Spirochaetaceae bacterium]
MEKKTYVIGHKNPDTDSIVSAIAYAIFKREQGRHNCFAARAGNLNPQTEFILNKFGVEAPLYLGNLIPKAEFYLNKSADISRCIAPEEASLQEALAIMAKENLRVLPIVDSLGVYKGLLHYRSFALYIIGHVNPHEKASFPVSLGLLMETLSAQPITIFNEAEVKASPIVIAANYRDSFVRHLEENDVKNALVILGDRFELQRICIEKKVRAIILSNGYTLSPEMRELAQKNKVTVLSSPYDTSSTSMLIMYSVQVGSVADKEVPVGNINDTVRSLREPLTRAPARSMPIVDDSGRVAGILQEGDLLEEPNIEIIMVDHNEKEQAIEGIENYRLLEVIDHHRLGNISTRYPITFINKPVGATATIIANLYRDQRVALRKEIASILLCAILTDTVFLKSTTTTDIDRETAEYLSRVTGLDIESLSLELQGALDKNMGKAGEELISLDYKEYTEAGQSFSVSQIETTSFEMMDKRFEELLGALSAVCNKQGYLFSALMLTNVTSLNSILLIAGDSHFISSLEFQKKSPGIFILNDVLSRKKQLIPLLCEQIESLGD